MKEEKLKDCINCQKELVHPEGRRPKKYCNDNCKAEHWRKTHKGKGKFVNRDRYEKLQAELAELKLASISGENVSTDIAAKVKEIKAAESPKNDLQSPFSVRPANLAELKAMCPHEKGDERSVWIATERQKYGI